MKCTKCDKEIVIYDYTIKAFGKQKKWLVPKKWVCETCGWEWKELDRDRVEKDLNKLIRETESKLSKLQSYRLGLSDALPGEYANEILKAVYKNMCTGDCCRPDLYGPEGEMRLEF